MLDFIDSNWIILIVFMIIVVLPVNTLEQFRNTNKSISAWCYVENPPPYLRHDHIPFVKHCLESHKKQGSVFRIQVLTPDNIRDFIHLPHLHHNLSHYQKTKYIQYGILNKYGGLWLPHISYSILPLERIECSLRDKGLVFFRDLDTNTISDDIIGTSYPNHPLITEEFLDIEKKIHSPYKQNRDIDELNESDKWSLIQKKFNFPVFKIRSNVDLVLKNGKIPSDISETYFWIPDYRILWRTHYCNWILQASKNEITKACAKLSLT